MSYRQVEKPPRPARQAGASRKTLGLLSSRTYLRNHHDLLHLLRCRSPLQTDPGQPGASWTRRKRTRKTRNRPEPLLQFACSRTCCRSCARSRSPPTSPRAAARAWPAWPCHRMRQRAELCRTESTHRENHRFPDSLPQADIDGSETRAITTGTAKKPSFRARPICSTTRCRTSSSTRRRRTTSCAQWH